jgi:RNA-directed DNA polymerase
VLDPLFHADSYGYRPGKSALEAVGQARDRCWRYDLVIDLDIKGFLDLSTQCLTMSILEKPSRLRCAPSIDFPLQHDYPKPA